MRAAVITLGANGAYVLSDEFEGHLPAFKPEKVVDTTGAGDAINGGLAAALAEGKSLKDAVIFGNAVAALSTTKTGTAPAMPTREEVDTFMANYKG